MTDDDDATLPDVLDQLDDVVRKLWPLVDDLTPHLHAEDDGPRRLELRAAQEHTAQAWAQAQHAVVVLRTLLTLDAPVAAPNALDVALSARVRRAEGGHAASCPLTCTGCWCSAAGACWHHR